MRANLGSKLDKPLNTEFSTVICDREIRKKTRYKSQQLEALTSTIESC